MARDSKLKTERKEKKRVIYMTSENIEGSMSVLPNPNYKAKEVYKCKGLGDLFSGNYYTRRAKHTITTSGYDVELEVLNVDHVLVQKASGTPPEPVKPAQPPEAPKPPAPKEKTYTVVSGDCLSKIAKRFGTSWQKIYEMNKDKIKNPNLIYPNQVLRIP